MSQFGASNGLDDDSSSLHSEFGPGMSDQAAKQQKLPLLSFKFHPGFFCFFEEYTKKQGSTFHECYEKVFKSHHEMMKIRRSTQQIVKDQSLEKTQKIKELMHRAEKDKVFAYYVKRPDGQLECNVVSHQDKRIQQVNKLKKQLEKLQKIKAKVIEQKKKEFHQKQVQRSKEQQLEIEGILNEKERRAQLIRKVQMEANERRIQRQKQRQANPNILHFTFNNCLIM